MGMRVRSRNCWICFEPALSESGAALEPFEPSIALAAVAHVRCLPLAELARRSVYRADGEKLGPNREAKLHVRTSGNGLLCKNDLEPKRRVGALREFGGVHRFSQRSDACVACARELEAQVAHTIDRSRAQARVVTSESS
jgi:hypothetical protein